ncbi:MAG: restriction endonuclease [Planctomycetes bacterium RBG_16_64_12]|nr:MAG: restriction endonuclease [Planctomycetes bacterium RBG_16_64_12]
MSKQTGPEFLRFFIPVVEVLRELGGSGRSAEVTDLVIDRMNIPEEEEAVILKSGQSRIYNQIAWARLYLVKAGLLDSSKRGVWSLTEKGRTAELTADFALQSCRETQSQIIEQRKQRGEAKAQEAGEVEEAEGAEEQIDIDSVDTGNYRTELLNLLRSLSPEGFERLSQRLLRESGFQQVAVTGRSGDGGIDGHGILRINPLVSFKVLFQCKRYQGTVNVSDVRNFRGALQGRADKGIILTTGTFTTDAKKEAIRDGATPIELVDGDQLVEMFEDLQIGLVPRADFDIDHEFFVEYK